MVKGMLLGLLKDRGEAWLDLCDVTERKIDAERAMSLAHTRVMATWLGEGEREGARSRMFLDTWEQVEAVDALRVEGNRAKMKLEHIDARLSAWKAIARMGGE